MQQLVNSITDRRQPMYLNGHIQGRWFIWGELHGKSKRTSSASYRYDEKMIFWVAEMVHQLPSTIVRNTS